MQYEVECVWPLAAKLGEGAMWLAEEFTLWFVDIKNSRIHSFNEATGERTSITTPELSAFIFPTGGTNNSGKFMCGLRSGLYEFDVATTSFKLLQRVDAEYPDNRLNDGYVDAKGRLWFGTMDNNETHPTGSLYCYSQQLKRMDTDYVITNGPTMSPDGKVLYHVDTLKQEIYAFDVDASGNISNRRVFVALNEPGVYPDGPTVDSNGNVWIALFGGWGVRCYSPQGQLLHKIDLPVSNCTKVAFGGEDLKTLYITTALIGLNDQQRKQQPLAGGLFRTRVDVAGLKQNQFLLSERSA